MIQSVERALDLLLLAAVEPQGVGLRELARRAGLKAATAQHLIHTLAKRGFLQWSEEHATYRPGPLAAVMASQYHCIYSWFQLLARHANGLIQRYGESVDSVLLTGGHLARIALFRSGETAPRLYGGLESRLPHELAMGLVLLAASPESVILSYAEEHHLVDFPYQLAVIRDRGYALSDDLPDRHGAIGLAMAVRGPDGSPLFAVNHHAPLARDTQPHRKKLLTGLRDLVDALESEIASNIPTAAL